MNDFDRNKIGDIYFALGFFAGFLFCIALIAFSLAVGI